MGKKKEVEEVMGIPNGGPLPGEPVAPPAPTGTPAKRTAPPPDPVPEHELSFKPLPGRFPYRYVKFDTDGATFTGEWVRAYAKGEVPDGGEEPLKYSALEFRAYGTGERVLLPGNQQLWEKFVDEVEPTRGQEGENEDGEPLDRTRSVFRITRTSKVETKSGNDFVNFLIEEATRPQVARK